MMTDLMDENMGHDLAEGVVMLAPIVEDRAAVEKHHVRQHGGIHHAFSREIDAVVKAEQVERRGDAETVEHLVGREILDANDEVAGELAKRVRQPPVGGVGDGLELGERRRLGPVPFDAAVQGARLFIGWICWRASARR